MLYLADDSESQAFFYVRPLRIANVGSVCLLN